MFWEGNARRKVGGPHWALPNLSRFDKSWTQSIITHLLSSNACHPTTRTHPTRVGIVFPWEKLLWDSEGCFRTGGNGWGCQCLPNLKGWFEEWGWSLSQAPLSPFSAGRTGKARRSHGHVPPSAGKASPSHGSPAGTLGWRGASEEGQSLGLDRPYPGKGLRRGG